MAAREGAVGMRSMLEFVHLSFIPLKVSYDRSWRSTPAQSFVVGWPALAAPRTS